MIELINYSNRERDYIMKQLTINLLTKREAELYCKRMYPETKIVPVTLCDEGKCHTYYSVYIKLANNRWMPLSVEPEYVGE